MSSSLSPGASLTPLDPIQLVHSGPALLSMVPDRHGIEPFPMPPVPKSMADWAALMCSEFLLERKRCLAVLLMLEVKTQNWGLAIPRQRASRDSSCWQPVAQDFPEAADSSVVAGSFQTRLFAPGDEPIDAVPPVDGVHLILHAKKDLQTIVCFVRASGQVSSVPAPNVIYDDSQRMLSEAFSRIELL